MLIKVKKKESFKVFVAVGLCCFDKRLQNVMASSNHHSFSSRFMGQQSGSGSDGRFFLLVEAGLCCTLAATPPCILSYLNMPLPVAVMPDERPTFWVCRHFQEGCKLHQELKQACLEGRSQNLISRSGPTQPPHFRPCKEIPSQFGFLCEVGLEVLLMVKSSCFVLLGTDEQQKSKLDGFLQIPNKIPGRFMPGAHTVAGSLG